MWKERLRTRHMRLVMNKGQHVECKNVLRLAHGNSLFSLASMTKIDCVDQVDNQQTVRINETMIQIKLMAGRKSSLCTVSKLRR